MLRSLTCLLSVSAPTGVIATHGTPRTGPGECFEVIRKSGGDNADIMMHLFN